MGAVAPLNVGFGGIAPENYWILTCKSVHFDAFCVNHYAKLYTQLARYFSQFIVLGSTLQLQWIQPTDKLTHRNAQIFCSTAGYTSNFSSDIRYFVTGWSNIAGDASLAFPAALTPLNNNNLSYQAAAYRATRPILYYRTNSEWTSGGIIKVASLDF